MSRSDETPQETLGEQKRILASDLTWNVEIRSSGSVRYGTLRRSTASLPPTPTDLVELEGGERVEIVEVVEGTTSVAVPGKLIATPA